MWRGVGGVGAGEGRVRPAEMLGSGGYLPPHNIISVSCFGSYLGPIQPFCMNLVLLHTGLEKFNKIVQRIKC